MSVVSIYFLFRHFGNKAQGTENLSTNNNKKNQTNNILLKNKNLKQEFNYQPIQPTGKEPEYRGELLPISSVGTEYTTSYETKKVKLMGSCSDCGGKGKAENILYIKCGVCEKSMEGDGKLRCEMCNKQKFYHNCDQQRKSPTVLPCGSAILTGSGDLEKQGIKAIVHACPGSIEKKDKDLNIQGVIRSVQNSILLAERNGYKSLAFCLIGSNFLDNIISPNQGTKKERQIKLAEIIVRTAVEQRKNLEKIVFVDFGNAAFQSAYGKVGSEHVFGDKKSEVEKIEKISATSGVVSSPANGKPKEKGITDYSLHKCEVIVNSLNIEGEFINSGSFSGFIASKTGSGKNQIQKEIEKHISEFNKRLKK